MYKNIVFFTMYLKFFFEITILFIQISTFFLNPPTFSPHSSSVSKAWMRMETQWMAVNLTVLFMTVLNWMVCWTRMRIKPRMTTINWMVPGNRFLLRQLRETISRRVDDWSNPFMTTIQRRKLWSMTWEWKWVMWVFFEVNTSY